MTKEKLLHVIRKYSNKQRLNKKQEKANNKKVRKATRKLNRFYEVSETAASTSAIIPEDPKFECDNGICKKLLDSYEQNRNLQKQLEAVYESQLSMEREKLENLQHQFDLEDASFKKQLAEEIEKNQVLQAKLGNDSEKTFLISKNC